MVLEHADTHVVDELALHHAEHAHALCQQTQQRRDSGSSAPPVTVALTVARVASSAAAI
jgi:hypothetical protein